MAAAAPPTAAQEEEQISDRERAVREKEEAQRSEREKMAADRASLPIYPYREEFIQAVMENQILVIVAETGAGKTTQVCEAERGVCLGVARCGGRTLHVDGCGAAATGCMRGRLDARSGMHRAPCQARQCREWQACFSLHLRTIQHPGLFTMVPTRPYGTEPALC